MVFLRSGDKIDWQPIPRDEIPEWLKDEALIDRMIGGEAIRNTQQDAETGKMWWYAITAVNLKNVPKRAPSSLILPEGV